MLSTKRLGSALLVWGLCSVLVGAADKTAKTEGESAADIAKLVKQLDADRFHDRQAASARLAEIGKPAIAALQTAALDDSLETSTRAMDLLEKFLASADDATKAAARTALESIAKTSHPSAAGRAQQAVQAATAANAPVAGVTQIQGGVLQLQAGPAQVQVGPMQVQVGGGVLQLGGNAGVSSMSVTSTAGGGKEIEAEENGRKVKIEDDPKQGIKMEVTEQKGGKDVTEKYHAKNADELKNNKPEAYKIYKQYALDNQMPADAAGTITITGQAQAQAMPALPGGAIPAMPLQPAMPFQPALPLQQPLAGVFLGGGAIHRPVDPVMELKALGTQVESLTKDRPWKDGAPADKEKLQKQVRELSRQVKDLEAELKKE